jgi:uncharacterized protein YdiU (UPF0061 family)
MADAFFARLGLERTGTDDFALIVALLTFMEGTRAPFERVFFDWFCGRESLGRAQASPLAALYAAEGFAQTRTRLLAATPARASRLLHPYFASAAPCTLLIDEVEALWAPIAERDDWSALYAKLEEIGALREALGLEGAQTFAATAA